MLCKSAFKHENLMNMWIFEHISWCHHVRHDARGKSGPALAGTEYRLMPSAWRPIVRAYRLLPFACRLPIELRKLRNQMKQFANPGGILASLPSLNLSHWALICESKCILLSDKYILHLSTHRCQYLHESDRLPSSRQHLTTALRTEEI